jgi:uncharacterized protein
MEVSEVDRFRVIDTDTHVVEPYDLWTSRVSVAKWGDLVPHVHFDDDLQEDAWYFGETRVARGASAASAGWPEWPPNHPRRIEDAARDTWDPEERLRTMDRYGIWAQVLYPNVAGFGAGRLLTLQQPDLMIACVRAYNDFLSDWASIAPDRFVAVSALPMWDIQLSIREMQRCAEAGHRGVIMTGEPTNWNLPKLADPHWDPLWAAAQELETPINFHIASGDLQSVYNSVYEHAGRHANHAGFGVQFGLSNLRVISNLITGGVCHRFPDLKFVSVESGIGWIPFALNHLDWMWLNCGVRDEHPEYDLLPSEYFTRQIYGCFWFETDTVKAAIDQLGANWILYETDFPHAQCMAPGLADVAVEPRTFIADGLGDLPDDTLQAILHDNAAKLYRLT